MVGLTIAAERLICRYGALRALDGVSLTVAPGEFLVVLGASGCGKTTLLRAIAGFHQPTSGTVRIGERLVSGPGCFVPPEERALGIVFQSYALWPHMTVAENVGFALKALGRADRQRRVAQALAQVGLAGFEFRRPAALSGGQRQRVALARCLAKAPGVVLMDEPLANLDPALRGAMQDEFVAMHRQLGSSFVYVTHDQSEALAIADRIALMEHGRVLQCAAPKTIYERPANAAVAQFLGNGALLPVLVLARGEAGRTPIRFGDAEFWVRAQGGHRPGPARLCVRAHDLALDSAAKLGAPAATVLGVRYQGSHSLVRVRFACADAPDAEIAHAGQPPAPGDRIGVHILDGWILPDSADQLAREPETDTAPQAASPTTVC